MKVLFARYFSNYVVQGAGDNCCKVIDVSKAKHNNYNKSKDEQLNFRSTYYGHTGAVTDAAISPTHQLLVSCSEDTDLRFYDLNQKEVSSLVFSQTAGERLSSVDFLSSS